MSRFAFSLLSLFIVFCSGLSARAESPVNAILGDESWIQAHGRAPTADDSNVARIQTHLAYVIARLEATSVAHLSGDQRQRRARLLDALREYALRAEFPVNDVVHDRVPRFVDPQGRTCAVGHLIEVASGRDVVKAINVEHEWDYISEFDSPFLRAWADENGFSVHELAMIQPGYPWMPGEPRHPIPVPPRPTSFELHAYFSSQTPVMQQCALDEPTVVSAMSARIQATLLVDNTVRIVVQSTPRNAAFEACVRNVLQAAGGAQWLGVQTGPPVPTQVYLQIPRPMNPHQPYSLNEVRATLGAQNERLLACLPFSGIPGHVTLQIAAMPNGSLQLVGVSMPRHWRYQENLQCLAERVANIPVTPPTRRIVFAHQLQLAWRTPPLRQPMIRHPLILERSTDES